MIQGIKKTSWDMFMISRNILLKLFLHQKQAIELYVSSQDIQSLSKYIGIINILVYFRPVYTGIDIVR